MFLPRRGAGVLVTRPEATAGGTMARVAARGLVPVAAPVAGIVPLPCRLDARGVQAVLVTSANAVPALGAGLRGLRLFAVGDATGARVRAAGFAAVESAAGDAAALAALVGARCVPRDGALLLPTARGEGLALAAALRAAGFAVRRRAVYAAVPHKTFPEPARAALAAGTIGAALFFSAATARRFAQLARTARVADRLKDVDALALSPAVAAPLAALPWRRICVAARPDQDSLMTLLADEAE